MKGEVIKLSFVIIMKNYYKGNLISQGPYSSHWLYTILLFGFNTFIPDLQDNSMRLNLL